MPYEYIERISGISDFIDAWNNIAHPANKKKSVIIESDNGNINNHGVADASSRAKLFTTNHPQFEDCLEAKIKPLVLLFAKSFNWITYSSCEGHNETMQQSGQFSLRNICLLARDQKEKQDIINILTCHIDFINVKYKDKIKIDIIESKIYDFNDQVGYITIRILFAPNSKDNLNKMISYFSNIDKATNDLATLLTALKKSN